MPSPSPSDGFFPLPFKNEVDQQAFLDTILPPKEVFLSTCFLMQDSDNIFDVTPKERLDILRDVF